MARASDRTDSSDFLVLHNLIAQIDIVLMLTFGRSVLDLDLSFFSGLDRKLALRTIGEIVLLEVLTLRHTL